MIDLHSHILPALCDGSPNINTSLKMAQIAVNDGITVQACTPHIYPGLYNNNYEIIYSAMEELQFKLNARSIPLKLVIGADVHMVPEVMEGLKSRRIPTLNNSRYFLLEPNHHIPVPRFVEQAVAFVEAGYIPLITHPERLRWLNNESYSQFITVAKMGVWIQLTAGAIEGKFGRYARYWANRFLKDGVVHVVSTDSHGDKYRPPILSKALLLVAKIVGKKEANRIFYERTQAVVDNLPVEEVVMPSGLQISTCKSRGIWGGKYRFSF